MTRSRVRIGYLPWFEASVEKGYTVRMREVLGALGDVVRFDGILAAVRAGRLDLLVLNWTDNELLDRRSRTVVFRKVMKLFAKTIALRLAARRLVFVRHNNYPHAVAQGHAEHARRWVDRYERLFDVVLSHSGEEPRRSGPHPRPLPRHYCPHPLYRRVAAVERGALLDRLPERYCVVFGRIVRYKHIAELIDAFPSGHTLVVIGAIGDRTYADELVAKTRTNVIVAPGLLSEPEAQAIVARSTALLITHADEDVVVSSSFFFAMSLQVPVIAVATPFLRWMEPRLDGRLLRVTEDLQALCRVVADDPTDAAAAPSAAMIQREFGDATVVAALRRALDLEE